MQNALLDYHCAGGLSCPLCTLSNQDRTIRQDTMKTASQLKAIIEATQKHDQWYLQLVKKREEIALLKERISSRDLNLSHCHAEIERLEESNHTLRLQLPVSLGVE